MLARIFSCALSGVDAYPVEIETDVARGLPATIVVGLPDASVREARDRVRSAIEHSGFEHPPKRITVNLAPACSRKEGSHFDLPIALGILAATGQLCSSRTDEYLLVGELALTGQVRPVAGVLAMALAAAKAGKKGILVPHENARQAGVVRDLEVRPVSSLAEALGFMAGDRDLDVIRTDTAALFHRDGHADIDLADIKGQPFAKRALELSAAGAHHLLMIGPPGSGKSLLAKSLAGILPQLNLDEALETTKIHSVNGALPFDTALVTRRPFRSPHHTISDVGLVGGGSHPRPGEASLSHHGVLFLDELPEFRRNTLEVLRQPLEDGRITVTRATGSMTFPARFMLVAAMNPCPCGYFTDPVRSCRCNPHQIQRYRSRISGPLLDRIDIHIEVPPVRTGDLFTHTISEPSLQVRERVEKARRVQLRRLENERLFANGQLTLKMIRRACRLSDSAKIVLQAAVHELRLSARSHDKILKVARTIADMEESELIEEHHLSEAVQYRSLDQRIWNE